MNQETMPSGKLAVFSFVAGALVGALVVALTTRKTGPEVRADLKALGRRAKGKVGELSDQAEAVWNEARDRTDQSMADLKRGVHEAATDLRVGIASPAARSTEVGNGAPLT
jgi:gas vesicle protein